jgi:hypothetical protein
MNNSRLVGWSVSIEGREDRGGILLVVGERIEAESLAEEIRQRGVRVVARPIRDGSPL